MKTFFICGTPRSRTAWLANFLTTSQSFCFHELLAECENVSEMRKRLSNIAKCPVGSSDSGNTLFIDEIVKEFPSAKIVVIKRDPKEVVKSLMNSGLCNNSNEKELTLAIHILTDKIKHIEKTHECLVYDYNSLVRAGVCSDIFEYCTGMSFDHKRWELLNNLNVQVEKDFEIKRIKSINKELLNSIQK